jgi:hypothetical protein
MPAPSRPVDGSLVFPNQRDVIAADTRRFRTLPAADRWREIFGLCNWATRLAQAPSRGDVIRRLEADQEARWRAIQQKLFAHHGE